VVVGCGGERERPTSARRHIKGEAR